MQDGTLAPDAEGSLAVKVLLNTLGLSRLVWEGWNGSVSGKGRGSDFREGWELPACAAPTGQQGAVLLMRGTCWQTPLSPCSQGQALTAHRKRARGEEGLREFRREEVGTP